MDLSQLAGGGGRRGGDDLVSDLTGGLSEGGLSDLTGGLSLELVATFALSPPSAAAASASGVARGNAAAAAALSAPEGPPLGRWRRLLLTRVRVELPQLLFEPPRLGMASHRLAEGGYHLAGGSLSNLDRFSEYYSHLSHRLGHHVGMDDSNFEASRMGGRGETHLLLEVPKGEGSMVRTLAMRMAEALELRPRQPRPHELGEGWGGAPLPAQLSAAERLAPPPPSQPLLFENAPPCGQAEERGRGGRTGSTRAAAGTTLEMSVCGVGRYAEIGLVATGQASAAVLLSAVVALHRVIPDKLSLSFCFGAAPPFSLLLRALKALLRETAEVAEACSAFLAWAAQEAAEATAAERSAAAGVGEGGVTPPPRQQPAKALSELRCTAAALQGATDESMSVLHGLLGTATVDQA